MTIPLEIEWPLGGTQRLSGIKRWATAAAAGEACSHVKSNKDLVLRAIIPDEVVS
jgi:hypothetical protein